MPIGSNSRGQTSRTRGNATRTGWSPSTSHQPYRSAPFGLRQTSTVRRAMAAASAMPWAWASVGLRAALRIPRSAGNTTKTTRTANGSPTRYSAALNTAAFAGFRAATVVVAVVPANTIPANTTNVGHAVRRDSEATATPRVHAHRMRATDAIALAATEPIRSPRAAGLSRYAGVQFSM